MTDYYAYVDGHPSTTSDSPSSMYAMPMDQKSGSVYADADFAVDAYGPRFRDLQEKMLKMEISYSTQPTQQNTTSLPSSFYYMVDDDEDKYEAGGDKKTKAKKPDGYVIPEGSAPSYAAGDGDSFPIDIYATVNGAQDSQKHNQKVEVRMETDSQYVIVTGKSDGNSKMVDEYSAVEGKYAPYEGDDAMQKQKAMAAIKAKQARADSDRSDSEDSGSDEDSDEGGEEDSDEDYMDEEDNGNSAMPKMGSGRVGSEFWAKYYWNEKFQTVLERPTTTPEEAKQRSNDIHGLARLFVDEAVPVVKQIVSEILLPDEEKTIKPVNVGGVAGGDKYMTKQLFIKFAKDDTTYHLYGGDDFAQKAAGHELKSLNSLISCSIRSLHFPLMALANFLGYRVIVVSKLPIGSSTLKYGSADGGFTIATDKGFSKKMKQVANILNLKGHYVKERRTGELKLMYGPVDLEGHIGRDGRYYCVDTARLFPPVTPNLAVRGCHLFRLLRSEAVKKSPHPLSSDAFTGWGAHNKKRNNTEVMEITRRLLNETIPSLVQTDVLRAVEKRLAIEGLHKIPEIDIKSLLHEQGINMRYLGILVVYCGTELSGVRNLLWAQMVGRAFAAIVHNGMRSLPAPRPKEDYYGLAINHLNLLLGSGAQSEAFWNDVLVPAIKRRFVFLDKETDSLAPGLRSRVLLLHAPSKSDDIEFEASVQKLNILHIVLSLTAIHLKKDIMESLSEGKQGTHACRAFAVETPLQPDDLEEIGIRWKIMGLLDLAERKGAEGDFKEAENYYKEELRIKREALGNVHPLLALPLSSLAHLYATANKPKKAEQAYLKALALLKKTLGSEHVEVAGLLDNLASLYIRYDQVEKAEVALVEALRIKRQILKKEDDEAKDDSDVAATLETLALAYTKQGKYDEAESVYQQVMTIKEEEYGPRHWEVARTMHHRCLLLLAKGPDYFAQTLPIAEQLVEMVQEVRGAEHSDVGMALDTLGQVYVGLGRYADAETVFKHSLRIKMTSVGPRHSSVAATLDHLAYALAPSTPNLPAPSLQKAVECSQKALEIFEQIYGDSHSHVGIVKNNLAVLYVLGAQLPEARDMLRSALTILQKSLAPSHPLLASVEANLKAVASSLSQGRRQVENIADLKRYFHGQHYHYSQFGNDAKREEKLQKDGEAEQKAIPPEWQKLFEQAKIDVSALSYEKAQTLIAALKKKLTEPAPAASSSDSATAGGKRLAQSAFVPSAPVDAAKRADLLRSQPAGFKATPPPPLQRSMSLMGSPPPPPQPAAAAPPPPPGAPSLPPPAATPPTPLPSTSPTMAYGAPGPSLALQSIYAYSDGAPAPPPQSPSIGLFAYYESDAASAEPMAEDVAGAYGAADGGAASAYAYTESLENLEEEEPTGAIVVLPTPISAPISPLEETDTLERKDDDDDYDGMELEEREREDREKQIRAQEEERKARERESKVREEEEKRAELRRDINEAKNMAQAMVNQLLERGNALEAISEETERLAQAKQFKRKSSFLSRLPSISLSSMLNFFSRSSSKQASDEPPERVVITPAGPESGASGIRISHDSMEMKQETAMQADEMDKKDKKKKYKSKKRASTLKHKKDQSEKEYDMLSRKDSQRDTSASDYEEDEDEEAEPSDSSNSEMSMAALSSSMQLPPRPSITSSQVHETKMERDEIEEEEMYDADDLLSDEGEAKRPRRSSLTRSPRSTIDEELMVREQERREGERDRVTGGTFSAPTRTEAAHSKNRSELQLLGSVPAEGKAITPAQRPPSARIASAKSMFDAPPAQPRSPLLSSAGSFGGGGRGGSQTKPSTGAARGAPAPAPAHAPAQAPRSPARPLLRSPIAAPAPLLQPTTQTLGAPSKAFTSAAPTTGAHYGASSTFSSAPTSSSSLNVAFQQPTTATTASATSKPMFLSPSQRKGSAQQSHSMEKATEEPVKDRRSFGLFKKETATKEMEEDRKEKKKKEKKEDKKDKEKKEEKRNVLSRMWSVPSSEEVETEQSAARSSRARLKKKVSRSKAGEAEGLRLAYGPTKSKAKASIDPDVLQQQRQREVEALSLDLEEEGEDEEGGGQPSMTTEEEAPVTTPAGGEMLIEDWVEQKKPSSSKDKGKEKEKADSSDDEEDDDLLDWDIDEDEGDSAPRGGAGAGASDDADLLSLIGEEKERELIAFLQQAQAELGQPKP